jgi:hypothetical protein
MSRLWASTTASRWEWHRGEGSCTGFWDNPNKSPLGAGHLKGPSERCTVQRACYVDCRKKHPTILTDPQRRQTYCRWMGLEEEELHQSSQMRLIRRNTNTRAGRRMLLISHPAPFGCEDRKQWKRSAGFRQHPEPWCADSPPTLPLQMWDSLFGKFNEDGARPDTYRTQISADPASRRERFITNFRSNQFKMRGKPALTYSVLGKPWSFLDNRCTG